MRRISTDLPFSYRLDLRLVKRRGVSREESILPDLGKIAKSRSGNKISRYFRHIFEHKNIRRVLGSHIAIFVIAGSSFAPAIASSTEEPPEQFVVSPELKIKTEEHIQYPLEHIRITQGYYFLHPGIDFDGDTGEPVRPVMAGVVEMVQYSNYAYGNAILVRHGDNFSSLYAHLSKIQVEEGQRVNLDTIMASVGSTGRSSGAHLHLEIRENGRPINPLSMLPRR